MAKKTKAAIKFTLTLTASAKPEDYDRIIAAALSARDELGVVDGTVTVTGPTHVRVPEV